MSLASGVAGKAALSVLSGRSSRRCAGALSSPSRWGWRLASSRVSSGVRRVRGRRRPRRSCGVCLGPRARAGVRGAGGRCGRLGSHGERLACASAFERDAQARWAALVPGGIDQETTRVVLPALVIAPWRRRSPLEFSLGVRPRNGPSEVGRNLFQSPSSTVSANAVSAGHSIRSGPGECYSAGG